MNERSQAISVLQQARDILAERLTERILESREAILEDALGLSYTSEIDAVQEQIGLRLNNVQMLLNNLPPLEDAPVPTNEDIVSAPQQAALAYEPEAVAEAEADDEVLPEGTVYYAEAAGVTIASPPALPAPPPAITFQSFAERVMANDLEGAGVVLAGLLDVSQNRGRECARRFQEQLAERPQFLQKAMTLRSELAAGSVNGALLLLWECFGLQGLESIAALQSLKTRLSGEMASSS
ncbi:MAG: hypothetical protein QM775_26450 [Pirellulales bacterium]